MYNNLFNSFFSNQSQTFSFKEKKLKRNSIYKSNLYFLNSFLFILHQHLKKRKLKNVYDLDEFVQKIHKNILIHNLNLNWPIETKTNFL